MISYLAGKLASYVVKNDDTADYDVLQYGFDLFLQEAGVIILAVIIGLILGILLPVIIAIASYFLLRSFAGGLHAKYRIVCIITTVVVMFGPSYVFTHMNCTLSQTTMFVLYGIDIVLLLLYAPADTEIKPVQSPGKRKKLKIQAVTCLSFLMIIAMILFGVDLQRYASVLVTTVTIVCCFTHPLAYKLYVCNKSKITMEVTT